MDKDEITNRYMELRGCKTKRSYVNKKQAKAAAKRMNYKTDGGRIRAYSCKFCELYHIGHIRPSYEDRKENERIESILKNAA